MHRHRGLFTALVLLSLFLLQAPRAAATQPGSNGRLAFHRTVEGTNQVFTIGAEGGSQTQLTSGAGGVGPHYSGDGQKILYTVGSQIYTMQADGTGPANLSNNGYTDTYGTYSPDGTKIVFQSLRNGESWNVYSMDAGGGNQVQLTTQGGMNDLPAWSPDGSKIVYRHIDPDGGDGQQDLWLMDADGGNAHELTRGQPDDEHPSWSPDGSRIAFMSKGRETNGDSDYEIYTISADGSDVRQLTSNTFYDSNPNWSPDGTRIAFNTLIGGTFDIYTMDLTVGSIVNLTNTPGIDEMDPDWQPLPAPYVFTGFFEPIDLGAPNAAKAGQAIPLKWRLVDHSGAPVADPASFVSLTSTATPGGCGGTADPVTTAAGASGLQYLGDGLWQYNWKTPREYAGQCRTLVLALKGGITQTARFTFK